MLRYGHYWELHEWGKNYGDMSVASIISWSEMIFFYQCHFLEIMTSPEPISSYCQWHLAPVSTLWNHQIRSSELICDRPGKGQQHLSSLSSSLTAALPGCSPCSAKHFSPSEWSGWPMPASFGSCLAFRACDNEECTEVAQQNRLVWFLHLERPVRTQNFRTRGEKIQAVNKKTSCKTARAGENKIHNM